MTGCATTSCGSSPIHRNPRTRKGRGFPVAPTPSIHYSWGMNEGCECCGKVETTKVRKAPSGGTHEACDACNAESWETHRIDMKSYKS